jgi:hypothetical protein
MSDHQKGQDTEKNIGSGEEHCQPTDGKKESLSDKKDYVFGSLFLEEEIKSSFDSFFLRFPGIEDLNFVLVEFQDISERLFLPQDSFRKKSEFLFSQFKEFFPARSFNLDLADWIGRKISVFVLVVADEEELHGVIHFSISIRVGASFVSYRINFSNPVLREW